jgi:hypothetical protein
MAEKGDDEWNAEVVRKAYGLSDAERSVLVKLADAWTVFVALKHKGPDDDEAFKRAIHAAQHLVALRVARRVNPETWVQPPAPAKQDDEQEADWHCAHCGEPADEDDMCPYCAISCTDCCGCAYDDDDEDDD